MSLSNDMREKIHPNPLIRQPADILVWVIIVMQLLIALGALPFLPAVVPIHWDAHGQPNGYGSKMLAALLFPGISLGLFVLLRVLTMVGPRLGDRASMAANAQVLSILTAGIVLFLLIVQLSTIAIVLGMNINTSFITNLGLAVLFIFLGNYMGKVRRNFWMGIRTPWTITSEVVWERTHRLGGWLFVAVGLLGVLFSFVPPLRIWGMVVLIIIVAVFLYIYSYLCYRQHTFGDHEPLTPPFEQTHQE